MVSADHQATGLLLSSSEVATDNTVIILSHTIAREKAVYRNTDLRSP